MASNQPLLEVDGLTVEYRTNEGPLTAVSDVSFEINSGEFFGLVGESGCGKSTLLKAITGSLDSNGEITGGTVRYKGESERLAESENQGLPWSEIAWIPQASMSSLDPIQTIGKQAKRIGRTHTDLSDEAILDRLRDMFEIVGLPESRINDYPHEFSGGMIQRALIALALFLKPGLVLADEPTTALDVIMQDQVLKFIENAKYETDTSMMLITHDISVVFESCDRMGIMHSGQLCEIADVSDIFDDPNHPYTIMLQQAFPDIQHFDRRLKTIPNAPPRTFGSVDYCTFADRCPVANEDCRRVRPMMEPVSENDASHGVACHYTEDAKRELSIRSEESQADQMDIGGNYE